MKGSIWFLRRGVAAAIAAAAMATSAGSVSAATLLDDKFADGDITDGADPLDTNWVTTKVAMGTSTGAPWTTLQYATDNGAIPDDGVSSGVLRHQNTNLGEASRYEGFVGRFAPTTLAIGDSITLEFAYVTSTNAVNNNNTGLRFGLYNSNNTFATGQAGELTLDDDDFGYSIVVPTGNSVAPGLLSKELGGNDTLGIGTDVSVLDTSSNNVSPVGGTYQRYSMTITRTSATEVSFSASVLSAPHVTATPIEFAAAVDSNSAFFTFDEVIIVQGVVGGAAHRADNFLVTVVPEPASAGVLGLAGALALVRRRRSA
jgi:hypothetical protein